MNKLIKLNLMPAIIAGIVCTHSSVAATQEWDKVFIHTLPEPSFQLEANYWDEAGDKHQLKLERHGSHWLHRTTDNQLSLFAKRKPDEQMEIRLFDLRQKKVIDAQRTALYQVGIFEDWEQLATHLSKPKQSFVIANIEKPKETAVACHWSQITIKTEKQPRYQICWSADWNTVVSIQKQQKMGQWQSLFEVVAISPVANKVKDIWPSAPVDYQYSNVTEDLQAD